MTVISQCARVIAPRDSSQKYNVARNENVARNTTPYVDDTGTVAKLSNSKYVLCFGTLQV